MNHNISGKIIAGSEDYIHHAQNPGNPQPLALSVFLGRRTGKEQHLLP
jgi:hypothetical protein